MTFNNLSQWPDIGFGAHHLGNLTLPLPFSLAAPAVATIQNKRDTHKDQTEGQKHTQNPSIRQEIQQKLRTQNKTREQPHPSSTQNYSTQHGLETSHPTWP